MATMDFYNFRRPHDNGFWSLKTKHPRFDIWHTSKRIILAIIAYIAIGHEQAIILLSNPYVWLILIAYFGQLIFYNQRR